MQNEVNNGVTPVNPSTEATTFSQDTLGTMMNPTPEFPQSPKVNPLLKFGKAPLIIAIVLVVILVGGITYKVVSSSPKTVFKNSINALYKGLNNGIDEVEELSEKFDLENKALVLNGDVKLNVSDEFIKEYLDELDGTDININDYSLGGELGVDIKNERLSATVFLKGKSEKIEFSGYVEDGIEYMSSNLIDGILKLEETDIDFSEYLDLYDEIEENMDLDSENYDYVIEAFKNALVKSLDTKYMKKDSDEIKIAGEKVKVTKYTYTFDEDSMQSMVRTLADTLLEDKDFSKKLAKLVGEEKDTIEEGLKEIKKSAKDLEFENKAEINVYQKGLLNTAVGFNFKVDKEEYFHYYVDNDNIDIVYNDNGGDDYGTVVEITSKKKKDNSEVTVKYNDEKVAELTVRELSDKLIDLDYTLFAEDEEAKGTVYLSYNEEKTSIKGDYKFNISLADYKFEVSGSYGIESKDELPKVNKDKLITEDDITEEELSQEALDNLKKIAEKDSAFNFILESIEEAEIESKLNSDGMYPLKASEVKSTIESEKNMVLYVGQTKYSYSYYDDEYDFIDDLEYYQDDLDFYSYYLNQNDITPELKELLSISENKCGTETTPTEQIPENNIGNTPVEEVTKCEIYPIIYIIKDGKVAKRLEVGATSSEIEAALAEIGIK